MLLAGLGAGAVAAASPALGLGLPGDGAEQPASWWDRTFESLNSAGLPGWSAAVGETFRLSSPEGPHLLRVVAVTAFPASGPRPRSLGRSEAFSVEFERVAGPALPVDDGLYRLEHGAYPSLSVYMGAPYSAGRKTRLTAVFN